MITDFKKITVGKVTEMEGEIFSEGKIIAVGLNLIIGFLSFKKRPLLRKL